MATQATRKLRLAAEKLGKALAWFERGATAGKLTTNAQLDSALLKEKKSEKQKTELLKAQISIRVRGHGWARFNTAWSSSTNKTVGTVADLSHRVKQMFYVCRQKGREAPPAVGAAGPQRGDEAPQNARDADDSGELRAGAGVMREVAAQLQAEKAAAAKATEVARHNACALRQPDEPPAVEVGSHLEVLVLIEEPEEDGSISKEYSQWVAS